MDGRDEEHVEGDMEAGDYNPSVALQDNNNDEEIKYDELGLSQSGTKAPASQGMPVTVMAGAKYGEGTLPGKTIRQSTEWTCLARFRLCSMLTGLVFYSAGKPRYIVCQAVMYVSEKFVMK